MSEPGRVTILKAPHLPLDVAAAIAGRARWLRGQLAALDAELGVTFPPIEIVPTLLLNAFGGHVSHVAGLVNLRPHGESHRFVVQISAPALLEYDDDLLIGILAHEFLHVVHATLAVAQCVPGDTLRMGPDPEEYSKSRTDYRRLDVAMQVDAQQWLSVRLRRLAEMVEDDDNPRVQAALKSIDTNWVDRGLTVETVDPLYEGENVTINNAIIERAANIGGA